MLASTHGNALKRLISAFWHSTGWGIFRDQDQQRSLSSFACFFAKLSNRLCELTPTTSAPALDFAAELSAEPNLSGGVELVILGPQFSGTAITEAATVRKLWPDSKIVLLLEAGAPIELEKLLASEVDACVPLFVSAGTLMRTLDLIAATVARVLIVSDMMALPLIARTRLVSTRD